MNIFLPALLLLITANDVALVIEPALVTLTEQREIPAREMGVLAESPVRAMQVVRAGEVLARIDDRDVRLEFERARIKAENAQRLAESDVKLRHARKELELASAELQSIADANIRFPKSKPPIEVKRKRLEYEKAQLDVEQAEHDLATAQDEWKLAQRELAIAEHKLQRMKIVSPLDGMVVHIYRRNGEWVEPGQTVVRILRLDRLTVQGLIDGRHIGSQLVGRPVTFRTAGAKPVELRGVVTFVDPEVNPGDGLTRIKAEIGNPDSSVTPGMKGQLIVDSK